MKRSSLDWRLLSSAALFIFALVLIWPTVNWFSKPETERDRAEASVQPETDNPHFISLLEEMRAEGGEEILAHYRDLYEESKGTIRLGLDLQGGMYLSYIIEPVGGLDPSEAIEQALETIRNRVGNIRFRAFNVHGGKNVSLELPDRDEGDALRKIL